ncbi:tetratricopeptide repeat protein [Bradyrhizobium sp.]|uniref:tetratricopeptide repeat protein n=1 Tax=Bradyrhizobium sp. TaxID=376 RepID=UPI003C4E2B50
MTGSTAGVQTPETLATRLAWHLQQGQDHCAAGRIDDAIAALRAGLDAAGKGPAGCPAELVADLHDELGNAYLSKGHFDLASGSFRAALQLAPHLTSCWCNLGIVQLRTGKAADAIPFFLGALKLDPAHWESRSHIAEALMATRQYLVAKAVLQEMREERPQDGKIRHQLGKVCFELNEIEPAIRHLEQAIVLNPDDADNHYWIGGIRHKMGDVDAAKAAYARAAQIRPLIRRPATKSPPDFRVLALYAPFGGNTPMHYLFRNPSFDVDTLALFGPGEPDVSGVGDIDVVVNLISDADQAETMLPAAARIAETLDKPVVNAPAKILRTTRDAVADLLPGIPACRIPRILRLEAGADVSAAALAARLPFPFPVLARPAGTHGGDDFEKIETPDGLTRCLAQRPKADHYVIEYIDYASSDGHFRKYRLMFVGDEILPYHLAIGNGWKVHHISTEMASQPWMRAEEAAFLADPAAVFNAAHDQALRAVRERIGLDYFGIDCGLDPEGNLVVFEVNASMLVHDDNAEFPYKDAFVRAIKTAFEALLRSRARRS